MNKIGIIAVLLAFLLVASCSSDDEESAIVGNWSLAQFKVDCPASGESFDFSTQNGCYTFDGTDTCFFIELKEDGTGLVTVSFDGASDSYQITYTTTNTQLTICDPSNDCDALQINGNQLTREESEGDCTELYIFEKS